MTSIIRSLRSDYRLTTGLLALASDSVIFSVHISYPSHLPVSSLSYLFILLRCISVDTALACSLVFHTSSVSFIFLPVTHPRAYSDSMYLVTTRTHAARVGNIPPCPTGLDENLWKLWHSLLNKDETLWFAEKVNLGRISSKKEAVGLMMRNEIAIPSRSEFDTLKSLEGSNLQQFTRHVKWLRIPTRLLLTAAWVICKDKLSELIKLPTTELRGFLANYADPPEDHVLDAVPVFSTDTPPPRQEGESKILSITKPAPSGASPTEGTGTDLPSVILNAYRPEHKSDAPTCDKRKRFGSHSTKDDVLRFKRKEAAERDHRARSRSPDTSKSKKTRKSKRNPSPTGSSYASSDDDDNIPDCPRLRPRIIEKIKKGQYVDITDCIPSETDTESFILTAAGIRPAYSSSRPSIPTNFEQWHSAASVLCRIRSYVEPTSNTSNLLYIDFIRELYASYHPAVVYEYDSTWRTFCANHSLLFFPISLNWTKGQLILCRGGALLDSASKHCFLCQSIHHPTSACHKNEKLYVPKFFAKFKDHKDLPSFSRRFSGPTTGSTSFSRKYSGRSSRQFDTNPRPCIFFNKASGCRHDAATCKFRHYCSACKSCQHGETTCPSRVHEKRHKALHQRP